MFIYLCRRVAGKMDEYDPQIIECLFIDPWDEDTVELKCTCGIWTTYGRMYPIDKHDSWCDLLRKNK